MTKTPPLSIVSGEAGISPPRPLSHEGKALWDRVQHEYMVQDTGGCELLCLAGEALDRAQSLGAAIEKDGPVVYTRTGVPKTHPAVKEELARLCCEDARAARGDYRDRQVTRPTPEARQLVSA